MKIVLKCDDFLGSPQIRTGNYNLKFDRLMNITCKKDVRINLGVIGGSIKEIPPSIIQFTKDRLGKTIELFNHTYNHRIGVADLSSCNKETEEVFGVKLETFGAAYNAISKEIVDELIRLEYIRNVFITKDSDYKVALSKKNLIEINGYRELENLQDGSYIRLENFLNNYNKDVGHKIYQLHPFSWQDKDFDEFEKIITILKEDEHRFLFSSML